MQKVISLFQRNYETDRLVRNEVVENAEWVLNGDGIATEKIDGISCLVQAGRLYKRYDVKKGRAMPAGFVPAQDPDPITGHWPGWVPVGDEPDSKWHREAFGLSPNLPDGTYELVGPKVRGNPHQLTVHILRRHGDIVLSAPRDYEGIKAWLQEHPGYEGIVWHHPDGSMVKIKARDFGLPWPPSWKGAL